MIDVVIYLIMGLCMLGIGAATITDGRQVKKDRQRRIAQRKIKEFERQQHYEDHNSQSSPGRLTLP